MPLPEEVVASLNKIKTASIITCNELNATLNGEIAKINALLDTYQSSDAPPLSPGDTVKVQALIGTSTNFVLILNKYRNDLLAHRANVEVRMAQIRAEGASHQSGEDRKDRADRGDSKSGHESTMLFSRFFNRGSSHPRFNASDLGENTRLLTNLQIAAIKGVISRLPETERRKSFKISRKTPIVDAADSEGVKNSETLPRSVLVIPSNNLGGQYRLIALYSGDDNHIMHNNDEYIRVKLGQDLEAGNLVVIKIVDRSQESSAEQATATESLQHEIAIGTRYGLITDTMTRDLGDGSKVYMIQELLAGQDLGNEQALTASVELKCKIMNSALSNLVVLHGKNIVHADIHLRNIMYNPENDAVAIIDFGNSRELVKGKSSFISQSQSMYQDDAIAVKNSIPPSSAKKYRRREEPSYVYDQRNDLYQMGMTLKEYFFGGTDAELNADRPDVTDALKAKILDLIERMTNRTNYPELTAAEVQQEWQGIVASISASHSAPSV